MGLFFTLSLIRVDSFEPPRINKLPSFKLIIITVIVNVLTFKFIVRNHAPKFGNLRDDGWVPSM